MTAKRRGIQLGLRKMKEDKREENETARIFIMCILH
jgi:hypothetical protein